MLLQWKAAKEVKKKRFYLLSAEKATGRNRPKEGEEKDSEHIILPFIDDKRPSQVQSE